MLELFSFTGVMAVVGIAIWLVLMFSAIANDMLVIPFIATAVFVALHDWLSSGPTFCSQLAEHYVATLVCAVLYIPVGVLYSLWRWRAFVKDAYAKWQENPGLSKQPSAFKPSPSTNKRMIAVWVFHWPLSFAWYVCHDFVTHLFNVIYDRLASTYQRIADSIFDQGAGS